MTEFLTVGNINGCDPGWITYQFPVRGDFSGHHLEWLHSMTTNRRCVSAFDFANVSGCDQLLVGPTQGGGGTHDLLMTDVPGQERFAVEAPIVNSDHSSLSTVMSIGQAVQILCVYRRKVT